MKSFNDKENWNNTTKNIKGWFSKLFRIVFIKPYKLGVKINNNIKSYRIRRDLKHINKLRDKATNDIVKAIEHELLIQNKNGKYIVDHVLLYKKDYYYDNTHNLESIFTGYANNRYKNCIKYTRALKSDNKDIDYDYFYESIYNYFSNYSDIKVEYKSKKDFTYYSNTAIETKYIEIAKIK